MSQSLLIQRSYSYEGGGAIYMFGLPESQSLLIQRSYSYPPGFFYFKEEEMKSQSLLIQRSYSYISELEREIAKKFEDLVAIPSYSEVLFLLARGEEGLLSDEEESQSLLIQRSYSY